MPRDVCDTSDLIKLFVAEGYSKEDAEAAAAAHAQDDMEDTPDPSSHLIALDQIIDLAEGERFDTSVFDEKRQHEIQDALVRTISNEHDLGIPDNWASKDYITIGRYCQVDVNGNKRSTLIAECVDATWADYLSGTSFQFDGINLRGIPLLDWLATITSTKWTGKTYAVNLGPFPFTPTEASIDRLRPLLKQYGNITKVIIYSNRTVTIGFALGSRPMPTTRPRIPLIANGRALGVLMAPFHIKILGVKCCRFCPAIAADAHTPACETNKNDPNEFARRQKRKASQLASVAKNSSKGLIAREAGEIATDKHGREEHRGNGSENIGTNKADRPPPTVLSRIIA